MSELYDGRTMAICCEVSNATYPRTVDLRDHEIIIIPPHTSQVYFTTASLLRKIGRRDKMKRMHIKASQITGIINVGRGYKETGIFEYIVDEE